MKVFYTHKAFPKYSADCLHFIYVFLSLSRYIFVNLFINSDVYLQESDNRHQSIRAKSPVSRSAFDSEHITSGLRLTVAQHSDADGDSPKATNLRYCDVHSIYDDIIGIINRSEEFVYIITWHFKALNRLPEFVDAVKCAIDRGVWISLLLQYSTGELFAKRISSPD